MANPEHLEILKEGVDVWNRWRKKNWSIRADLCKANLRGADLYEANLQGANLERADFYKADFNKANFRRANLRGANFEKASLHEANLRGAVLHEANLRKANLERTCLIEADLYKANLYEVNLNKTDFYKANLERANLMGVKFQEVNLLDTNLKNVNLRAANLRGVDLQGVKLCEAELLGADFLGTNLECANLERTNLRQANFGKAYLKGAILRGANLESVDLRRCDIIDSNIDQAVLTGAKLWESKRSGWSIKGVICEYAYFDRDGEEKTEFKPGEFEKLYSEKTRIVLHYSDTIKTVEVMTLPALIKTIESENIGSSLRLESIKEEAGGVNVSIVVEDLAANDISKLREEAEQIKNIFRENQLLLSQVEGKYLGLKQFMLEAWRGNMGDTFNIHQVTGVVKAESSTLNQNINTNDLDGISELISEILAARSEIEKVLPPEKADELDAAFEVIQEQAKAPEKSWEKLKKGAQSIKNVLDGVGDTAGKWMPIVEKLSQAAQSLGMG